MEYVIHYSSNNSGGAWWLKDDDWHNLEANGWTVDWVKDSEFYNRYSKTDRFLGALAKKAFKAFEAPSEKAAIDLAIEDWESVTGQYVSYQERHLFGGEPIEPGERWPLFKRS